MHKFKWVIPNVLAGGHHPLLNDEFNLIDNPDWYTNHGIKSLISVFEIPISGNITKCVPWNYIFQPVNDGQPPRDLYDLCKVISKSNGTFVHCFAGTGRTATVLAAYLLFGGYASTAKEAIMLLRKHYYNGAVHTPDQYFELLAFSQESLDEKTIKQELNSLFKDGHHFYSGKKKYEKLLTLTKKEMEKLKEKFGLNSLEYKNSEDKYKKLKRAHELFL